MHVYRVASYPGCFLLAVLGERPGYKAVHVQDFFSLCMGYISENAVVLGKSKAKEIPNLP